MVNEIELTETTVAIWAVWNAGFLAATNHVDQSWDKSKEAAETGNANFTARISSMVYGARNA